MPKVVDYSGRFAFFELAAFALVRDHGVDSLSRHGVARVLATSISTVRRLLNAEADLRALALAEVGVRRRRRLRPRTPDTGVDAALRLAGAIVPNDPEHVAAELVWWRLAVAAPTTATLPPDDEGPLHHRFAVATWGFVPEDVLRARVELPRSPVGADGRPDVVVTARHERDADLAARTAHVVATAAPALPQDEVLRQARVVHAVVDGVTLAVALGRLEPQEALDVVRTHLEGLVGSPR